MYCLRILRAEDVAEVAAIEAKSPSPWSRRSLEQELEIKSGIALTAHTRDGRIVGWCAGRKIWPEAELLKITVHDLYRQQGVAALLLHYLCKELEHEQFISLYLEVRTQNMAAIQLYKRFGFYQTGRRPGYYTDPPDSAVLMALNLTTGAGPHHITNEDVV